MDQPITTPAPSPDQPTLDLTLQRRQLVPVPALDGGPTRECVPEADFEQFLELVGNLARKAYQAGGVVTIDIDRGVRRIENDSPIEQYDIAADALAITINSAPSKPSAAALFDRREQGGA